MAGIVTNLKNAVLPDFHFTASATFWAYLFCCLW